MGALKLLRVNAYLLRALHDWAVDSGATPEIIVDATQAGIELPRQLMDNDALVLNISGLAANGLEIGNEWLSMRSRFNGVAHAVRIPITAVRALRVRETGDTLGLPPGDGTAPSGTETAQAPGSEAKPRRPALRVVK